MFWSAVWAIPGPQALCGSFSSAFVLVPRPPSDWPDEQSDLIARGTGEFVVALFMARVFLIQAQAPPAQPLLNRESQFVPLAGTDLQFSCPIGHAIHNSEHFGK